MPLLRGEFWREALSGDTLKPGVGAAVTSCRQRNRD